MLKNKTLAAIPVFNEADVHDVIRKVKNFPVDVLVVDDGSMDDIRTNLLQMENIFVITHPRNFGYGKTIIDAFMFAMRHGYDYLITIDGDGQHEPEDISLFLKEIPFCNCDIISGSRYFFSAKISKDVPRERYLVNKEITGILNRITGFNLTDAFCGFKAYKVQKLKGMHLTEYGYGMPLQLWMQAWKLGLQVKEIPVKLIYKDPAKKFKGILNNPETRLHYYKNIIEREFTVTGQGNLPAWKVKKRVRS